MDRNPATATVWIMKRLTQGEVFIDSFTMLQSSAEYCKQEAGGEEVRVRAAAPRKQE